jgi:hypothetical protein
MHTTRSPHRPAWRAPPSGGPAGSSWPSRAWRRPCWPGACDSAQQVPWATYNSQLQPRIDAATATASCAALRAFLTAAKTTSTAHEKATGFPNDALVAYIQASQHEAGCPPASS